MGLGIGRNIVDTCRGPKIPHLDRSGLIRAQYLGLIWMEGDGIDRRLGIEDVLVDDEGGPPRVSPIAQSNLVNCAILAEYSVQLLGGYFERKVPNVQYPIHFRRKSGL